MSDLVQRLRSPLVTFEDQSLRHAETICREAADEIDLLTSKLEAIDQMGKNLGDEMIARGNQLSNMTAERDRLRAMLVKHGTHATGCTNQKNVGECSCGLWEALRGGK